MHQENYMREYTKRVRAEIFARIQECIRHSREQNLYSELEVSDELLNQLLLKGKDEPGVVVSGFDRAEEVIRLIDIAVAVKETADLLTQTGKIPGVTVMSSNAIRYNPEIPERALNTAVYLAQRETTTVELQTTFGILYVTEDTTPNEALIQYSRMASKNYMTKYADKRKECEGHLANPRKTAFESPAIRFSRGELLGLDDEFISDYMPNYISYLLADNTNVIVIVGERNLAFDQTATLEDIGYAFANTIGQEISARARIEI